MSSTGTATMLMPVIIAASSVCPPRPRFNRRRRAGHRGAPHTDETYEAVRGGIGICLLAAGNAPIFARGAVTMLPVADLTPCELVVAWNERHCPPLLETFAAMCEQVVTGAYTSPS